MELALVGSSQRWGAEKPDPAFFERICSTLDLAPNQVAYVGDRLDNDILPARAVGLRTVLVVRGPWGRRHVTWPEVSEVHVVVEELIQLLDAMALPRPSR